ncbi:Virus attachment protein p12 family protein [Geoalkalibacter ferrihydriticus]|uniref:FeoB-associated Cys-rich membrane protein n=2 Tax=Geoalkalibacter ferrihydriticus TaxID=392333 RepID=A0A0C2HX46_9BACT|nr:FeoB-associated Cys-rich membrane protein [Geoalkalibacter ferrihydriticus]KIH77352.1 hypothetical protein GFER_00955 [Geoalkalibacter ferrihydriticus DSM 17813]SDM18658.1 Virus attachment protein p12 family protein [Geoalkalibacter ferrihydriticus]
MGLWDSIITLVIVIGAAFYLYRKFSRTRSDSGCGCSGEGGCNQAGSSRDLPHAGCKSDRKR